MVVLPLLAISLSHKPQSTPPQPPCAVSERCKRKARKHANFVERRKAEVLRWPLPRTQASSDQRAIERAVRTAATVSSGASTGRSAPHPPRTGNRDWGRSPRSPPP